MTDTTIELRKKAKGERPQYFQDPAIDKVLAITMALAGEVAVMHDQIDTMQRLMEKGGTVTRADRRVRISTQLLDGATGAAVLGFCP